MREETDMTVEETDMIYERRNYYWRGKTQSRNQKQPKKRSKHSKFKAIVRWYVDCLKISSSSMWLCFITPTFKLNSWEVMRLYPQRYSGWAVVTVVFPCSSKRNLQGWSSNKIRALHIRYTVWRTHTMRLAVALLVEHPDIHYQSVSVVFFFRECLCIWVINVEAHSAHCRMAKTRTIPGRILPHTWYRVCPFWTVRCDSLLRRRTSQYMNMESLLRCCPPPRRTC